MRSPKVSIIIPVYNGEKYITHAIESVLAQTYKNFEIIIVNDGSTDSSFEKIKPYLTLPNIKYIEQENKGVAAARNTGIKNSTGELIGFLDQDDLWLPYKLQVQVDYLINNPDVGLVHSSREYIYENEVKGPPASSWPTNVAGMCFKDLFIRNQISVLTVLLRKECLNRVGLFDESISFADDYELWLRISRSYHIGYIDRIVSFYRYHEQNTSHNWVGMLRAELKVIETILMKFPEIYQELGDTVVKNRLHELYYKTANFYLYLDKQESARQYYWKALTIHPTKWDCWNRLLIWSFLSSKQRSILQWYKLKVSKLLHDKKENEHQ